MAIRDQVTGYLLEGKAGTPFEISTASSQMVGAVSQLVLPRKAFTRSTQMLPTGFTRRGASYRLDELRLTGNLRVWNSHLFALFGTDRYGGEYNDDGEPDTWTIRMVMQGYHLAKPTATYIEFQGIFDEFPEVTLAADAEEIEIPFAVEVTNYKEYYNDNDASADQTLENSCLMYHADANNGKLLVRRKYEAGANTADGMIDMFQAQRAIFGIS